MIFLSEKIHSEPSDGCYKSILNNRFFLVVISLLTILLLFLYLPTLRWLVHIWSVDEQYSHGFFIPFVSLYLVWSKREWLQQIPVVPSLVWGAVLILGSVLLLLVGRSGAFIQAEAISLFFFLPGITLFLLGREFLKVLGFAIFYLQFMIPWTDPLFDLVQPYFQRISATIGAYLLSLHYPVFSDGINIHLPNISMVVARQCSGINFLITILAVGLPLVYLTQKIWTRALAILAIGCLLSVFSNGLRVAIAGVMGEEYGQAMLHGPAHIFEGWFVAWFGWIGLFVVNWLFGKIAYSKGEPEYYLYERWRRNKQDSDPLPTNNHAFPLLFSTIFVLLLAFAVYLNNFAMPKAIPLNNSLEKFPTEIAGWQGTNSNWVDGNKFFPGLDNQLSRTYSDTSGNSVYLFIGYYQKQDKDKRFISYLSRPLYEDSETVTIVKDHSSFPGVSSTLQTTASKLSTLFWCQFPGKLKMTERLRIKLQILKSGILQRQNNGAIILLATPIEPTSLSDPKHERILQSFANDLGPVIDEFLP